MSSIACPHTQLLIDGEWCAAESGRTDPVVNPATDAVIGTCVHAGPVDVECAAASVQKGFVAWRRISAFERSKMMRKDANLLRERVDVVIRA